MLDAAWKAIYFCHLFTSVRAAVLRVSCGCSERLGCIVILVPRMVISLARRYASSCLVENMRMLTNVASQNTEVVAAPIGDSTHIHASLVLHRRRSSAIPFVFLGPFTRQPHGLLGWFPPQLVKGNFVPGRASGTFHGAVS